MIRVFFFSFFYWLKRSRIEQKRELNNVPSDAVEPLWANTSRKRPPIQNFPSQITTALEPLVRDREHFWVTNLEFSILFALVSLSSAKVSVLWVGWEERKRERAGHHTSHAFYFFDHCYFYRDTQREPLRRREPSCNGPPCAWFYL